MATTKTKSVGFRLENEYAARLEEDAKFNGFKGPGDYLRDLFTKRYSASREARDSSNVVAKSRNTADEDDLEVTD